MVARYGGEELAIVLPSVDSVEAAVRAEHSRMAVESLCIPHGDAFGGNVTVSVGAATALVRKGGSAETPHSLLAAADRALYLSKATGRNCCKSALLLASAA